MNRWVVLLVGVLQIVGLPVGEGVGAVVALTATIGVGGGVGVRK